MIFFTATLRHTCSNIHIVYLTDFRYIISHLWPNLRAVIGFSLISHCSVNKPGLAIYKIGTSDHSGLAHVPACKTLNSISNKQMYFTANSLCCCRCHGNSLMRWLHPLLKLKFQPTKEKKWLVFSIQPIRARITTYCTWGQYLLPLSLKGLYGFELFSGISSGRKQTVDWLKTSDNITLVTNVVPGSGDSIPLPSPRPEAGTKEQDSKEVHIVHAKLKLIEDANILQDDTAGKSSTVSAKTKLFLYGVLLGTDIVPILS